MPTETSETLGPRAVLVTPDAGVRESFAAGIRQRYSGPVQVDRCADIPAGPGIVGLAVAPPTELSASALGRLPGLRVLVAASAGYDHVPMAAASAAGLVVAHTPGYADIEVADHAIASVAMLLRGLHRSDRQVRSGLFSPGATGARRVSGASLGIAGFGRIGRLVAHRALALGMRVLVWAPRTAAETVRSAGAVPVPELADLLAGCVVLSLHLPLTDQTRGIIGEREIALLKRGSYLVNTGRGELVDVAALGRAIADGRLGGAALDTFTTEPLQASSPELTFENTVLSPHSAWYSPQSRYESYVMAGRAIGAVLAGEPPEHVVSEPREPGPAPALRGRLRHVPHAAGMGRTTLGGARAQRW
jgi:D-3-phosphoglycerate dehydrogenase